MSSTYAGAKGRAPSPPAPLPRRGEGRVRALSAEEQAKVAMRKAFVEEHIPEAVPFVKELYAEGLIDGWRSVVDCRLLNEGDGDGAE